MFLGYAVIPGMLTLLGLLAMGGARRQVNKITLHMVDSSVNVNGVRIKVLPTLAFLNFIYFYSMLMKIRQLNKIDEEHENENAEHSRYLEEVYYTYRQALLNICSTLLILQVYLTAARYEAYKPIKDKADKYRAESK